MASEVNNFIMMARPLTEMEAEMNDVITMSHAIIIWTM